MRRIAVIGCGGAGKSTLARQLGARLALPVVHGDEHRAEWERVQPEILRGDAWVIDAMRLGTLEPRLAAADTAIFLDRGTLACLAGIARRGSLLELRHREFLLWVVLFRRRHRTRVLELLERHRATTDVVVLRTRRAVSSFLAGLPPR